MPQTLKRRGNFWDLWTSTLINGAKWMVVDGEGGGLILSNFCGHLNRFVFSYVYSIKIFKVSLIFQYFKELQQNYKRKCQSV